MIPKLVDSENPVLAVRPVPIITLTAKVKPPASASGRHIAGIVVDDDLTYNDLLAFSWYSAQIRAWKVIQLNARKKFKGLHGMEDTRNTKSQPAGGTASATPPPTTPIESPPPPPPPPPPDPTPSEPLPGESDVISNRITFGPRGAALQWARATETGIKGYHIERSHEPGFPDWSYLRLTPVPQTGVTYIDTCLNWSRSAAVEQSGRELDVPNTLPPLHQS
ncbi:hypothetical protein GCM10008955_01360 [Deinococcus malanensis]|uniref:Uncharacterized protein n=1 Tax=Deinococcus malanensis TaxID=1706855 RepID=A0ABQ2EGQ1_9DEIO|nr:hypothetical protein GCM10008955_01360 [Deinococcus malanensis]